MSRFQALGDSGLQAAAEELWTLYTLGMAAYEQADWARAQAFHSRCVEQATVLGSGNHLTSLALYGLGRVAHQQGDYARARTLLEEALLTQRAVDDPAKAALTLVGLGQVLLDMHDADSARAAFTESLALFDGVGDQSGLAVLQLLKKLQERLCRRQFDAKWEGVDEQSHHGLDAGNFRRPTCHRDAEGHIVAACQTAEQNGPCGLNEGIEGETLRAGQPCQRRGVLHRHDLATAGVSVTQSREKRRRPLRRESTLSGSLASQMKRGKCDKMMTR